MPTCTTIEVEQQVNNSSELEVAYVDASELEAEGFHTLHVGVTNVVIEGDGERVTRELLVTGGGIEKTKNASVAADETEEFDFEVELTETGEVEICAELI